MSDRYAELSVPSHCSFLRGVASREELFATAAQVGRARGDVVDSNSVAGMVRAWEASKMISVRLIPGCRLVLNGASELLIYPRDVAAWSRLSRLTRLRDCRATCR